MTKILLFSKNIKNIFNNEYPLLRLILKNELYICYNTLALVVGMYHKIIVTDPVGNITIHYESQYKGYCTDVKGICEYRLYLELKEYELQNERARNEKRILLFFPSL